MSRDLTLYLDDIIAAIAYINEFTKEMTSKDFLSDVRTQHSCVRNLEVIGEAVKHIPPEVRRMAPKIEWKKIAGLRDVISHEYFGIDVDIIWDLIKSKLDDLKTGLSRDYIEFNYVFDNNLHDRWIETDTGWRIILGRGLDIFQKPDDKFTLGFIDQTKRKCKATAITYIKQH